MSGGNSNSFFSPKNIIPTILTGGIYPIAKGLKDNMTPTPPPAQTPPPVLQGPPLSATDANPQMTAQQKAKKLKALQFGMASTITSNNGANATNPANPMKGLKTALGQ